MRRKEHYDDTRFYNQVIDTILYSPSLKQADWQILFASLEEDLSNPKIYRPTAEKALFLVKLKLNEFDGIKDQNRIRLIQLNNEQLYQVVDIIKYSQHFESIKHKIIKILSRSKVPKHQLASLLA